MKNENKMISVEAALSRVLKGLRVTGVEEASPADAAGRVLAVNVKAPSPNPAWDNSGMDGYALRAGDTAWASRKHPAQLRVIYRLPAGSVPQRPVGMGEAVRIMTGAPVPAGADAIVILEETDEQDGYVLIRSKIRPGEHVRKRGSDFPKNSLVLKKGSLIGPAEIAMLSLTGHKVAAVHKKPSAAILSTGSELLGEDESPATGKIPDCNGPALASAVELCGGIPIRLGVAKDERSGIRRAIQDGLKKADCLITSGGVSVGDYDFVGDVLGELGGEIICWRVAMKPGKPFTFGHINGKPVFGLPGNTVSALMSFETFVRPALLKMSGRTDIFREYLYAELTEDIVQMPGRRSFLRSVLRREGQALKVTPLSKQGSGMLRSVIDSNAMIVAPEKAERLKKGSIVKVIPLNGFHARADLG